LRTIDVRPLSLTAQELGIARETLSRSLKRLVERHAIHYEGGQIQVINMEALEAVLEETECACQRISG
jgi:DNA-binding Lrp family transcriptional regulator